MARLFRCSKPGNDSVQNNYSVRMVSMAYNGLTVVSPPERSIEATLPVKVLTKEEEAQTIS